MKLNKLFVRPIFGVVALLIIAPVSSSFAGFGPARPFIEVPGDLDRVIAKEKRANEATALMLFPDGVLRAYEVNASSDEIVIDPANDQLSKTRQKLLKLNWKDLKSSDGKSVCVSLDKTSSVYTLADEMRDRAKFFRVFHHEVESGAFSVAYYDEQEDIYIENRRKAKEEAANYQLDDLEIVYVEAILSDCVLVNGGFSQENRDVISSQRDVILDSNFSLSEEEVEETERKIERVKDLVVPVGDRIVLEKELAEKGRKHIEELEDKIQFGVTTRLSFAK